MKCPGQDSRYWDGEAVFEADSQNVVKPLSSLKMTALVNAVDAVIR